MVVAFEWRSKKLTAKAIQSNLDPLMKMCQIWAKNWIACLDDVNAGRMHG